MKNFCNVIPEFCLPIVQEKILQLYENLEKQGLLPKDINLGLSSFNAKNNNLFFVAFNKDTEHSLRNLMSEIDAKTNRVIIIPNGEENYFDFAIEYNICNIIHITKLNETMLLGILKGFLKRNFDFESFFKPNENIFDKSYSLSGDISMLRLVEHTFTDFINRIENEMRNMFIINCHELVTNAIAYGVLGITAYVRDKKDYGVINYTNIYIPPNKEVKVRLMMNKSLYGISVRDFGGLLTMQRILERIRRQSIVEGETIPQGIEDYTGRGLAILSHHGLLLFSIKPGEFTEVSLISRMEAVFERKPISILATEL